MNWEYKFAEISALTDECEEQLNELGKEGWEVIKLDWIGKFGVVLLKRPKFDWGEFKTMCCGSPEGVIGTSGQVGTNGQRDGDNPKGLLYPIFKLPDGYEVMKPIIVRWALLEDGTVLVTHEPTESWIDGRTKDKAIEDMKSQLVALYEDLNAAADDTLGKLPLRWKQYLNEHISKVEDAADQL